MIPGPATSTERVRCAVVGLGVLGGAALLALARAGVDCVGLEAGRVGHPDGASGGGETRIFRTAVGDGPDYHRLLDRSRELWTDADAGAFTPCGALTLGPAGDARLDGAAVPGRTEVLGPDAAAERWPGLRVRPDDRAVFDPRGGLLDAARATRALAGAARDSGAQVRQGVTVLGVVHRRGRLVLRTGGGEIVADTVVLATGHRAPLLPGTSGIEQRRVVLSWFAVDEPERFRPAGFPPGVVTGGPVFSFFPTVDGATVKINAQRPQPGTAGVDDHHPFVEPGYARPWVPGVARRVRGLRSRPDRIESYVEGYAPGRRGIVTLTATAPRVVAVGGFSGQGFKYAPAVGEIVADLVRTGRARTGAFGAAVPVAG